LIFSGLLGKIYRVVNHFYRGANPHLADKEGNTPLKLASETGCVGNEILTLMEKR